MTTQSFAYCLRPIYYFARICGQMPFSITHQPNSSIVKVNFHKRDIIWLILSMSVQVTLIFRAIQMLKSYRHTNSATFTLHLGHSTIWFLNSILGICVMILDALNSGKIVRILNDFTSFDKEVRMIQYRTIKMAYSNCVFSSISHVSFAKHRSTVSE